MKNKDVLTNVINEVNNYWVVDAFLKANQQIAAHGKIVCSLSGGSDSDIMVDLIAKLDFSKKVTYVWFNTGLEYEATKRHLKELEQKYGIVIHERKATKPIPITCKTYGQPFLSKQVSEWIQRLQRYNFKWEDKPLEELLQEYPKCKAALRWWCNDYGEKSKFNIAYNTYLKEFMIANPPTFKISNKCCQFAKKSVAREFIADGEFGLCCTGVRKAEGGARSSAYKNCYTPNADGVSQYRPLFWFDAEAKQVYKDTFGVTYSDCYEVWGLQRTGCAACPFGRNFEFELDCIEKYEPKFYRAVNNIFGSSYEYTRKYRAFQQEMKSKQK